MSMYRNRALLDLARGKPCMLEIPGVCNHDPATTVACHSNQIRHGHGKGIKAHDVFCAHLCADCHFWLDSGPAPRAEKVQAFQDAFERTLLALFASGAVVVAGNRKSSPRASRERPAKASRLSSSKILPRNL